MVNTAQDKSARKRTAGAPASSGEDRRRFMSGLGVLALTALAGMATAPGAAAAPPAAPDRREDPIRLPKEKEGESEILRMQREMQKALAKPVEQRRWGMVIDLRKCVGCSACTIACKAENRLPPGVVYRPVIEEEIGEYPNVTRRFVPRPCMQCENPPCVPVCPVGATYKRPDGIVAIDYEACIGCRYCVTACPYQARTFDSGDSYSKGTPATQPYEHLVTYEYGKTYDREEGQSPVGNVRKCHFCLHRLNEGMLPECVTSCIGVATYFGDLNDPDSLVSELAASPNVQRLKEELGTKPRVFYLT
jgi:Fe-S-cluster-containing dehydrogenase component